MVIVEEYAGGLDGSEVEHFQQTQSFQSQIHDVCVCVYVCEREKEGDVCLNIRCVLYLPFTDRWKSCQCADRVG